MYYLYWGPWQPLPSLSARFASGLSLVPLILILSKVINTPKWNPGKPSICLVWFLLLENHWNPYSIKLLKTFLNLSYSCQLLFLWSCSPLPQLSFTPMIAPKFRLINLDSDCQESMRRWTNKTCMNGYAVSCFFVLRHVFFFAISQIWLLRIPTKAMKIVWSLWSWQLITATSPVCKLCVMVAQIWIWLLRPGLCESSLAMFGHLSGSPVIIHDWCHLQFSFTDYWIFISCRCCFVFAKSGEIAFTLSSYWRESRPYILSCEVLVRVGARLLMVQRVT